MNPADEYREELAENIYFCRRFGLEGGWEFIILCEEQDRVRVVK